MALQDVDKLDNRMKYLPGKVFIRQIRLHAFHGVLPQERIVGNDYLVDLQVVTDVQKAANTDRVEDTVNYADLYQIVVKEMGVPSALLEHVAGRIARKVCEDFPQIHEVSIDICKINPPVGGDCPKAGVSIHLINDKS